MEKIVQQGFLYDFYGELLTDHQKRIYEDVVFNDFSISEIAKEMGISRQGVHDLVKRCDRILEDYEEKLQLVSKHLKTKDRIQAIHKLTQEYFQTGDVDLIHKIEQYSSEILEL